MPLGPFGEIMGTTGTLETLPPDVQKYKSHVVAPRNPKLVRHNELDKQKMTPSKFMFEMSLSTEQKLANTHIMKVPRKIELLDMGDTSLQKSSKVNIDEPMFQPFPSEIYFQNFQPFEVYEVPLILRNNDKVPRLIKVIQETSPYFNIISPSDLAHKVGPGLPTTFRVQFTPDQNKDYKHELVCITEREKFIVPIKAIGARGILDFPDTIHFSSCVVKYPNTKTLLVRNIGSREAVFSLKVKPPFSVNPDIGALGVSESIQVTVEFKPLTVGDHKESLRLSYDTGEEILIGLYGAAHDANIRLDKNSIRIENTYISMASQRSVVIMNHSDIIAHFRWSKFATHDDEDQQKLLQQIELDREENNDTDQFLEECVTDPMLRDKLSILSRTFQNRKRAVENNPLVFHDDIVIIEPVEGDIWPNSTIEVTVVFRPREATTYTHTAYCDISGRESRLPLRIRGDGMGPKVEFSFEHLEMGNIFIGSKHLYEVVIANKGDIDAIYSVIPNNSIFGPCFAFNPAEGIVMPGGHQAIEVAFSSPYLGDFEEIFCFQVDGQPQQSTVKFSGQVMGPTFNFDVAKLKFGTVPFGFLSSEVCNLINTSLVPMVFKLRIPGDGTNKSVCCADDVQSAPLDVGPPPAVHPQEFTVIPSQGVISPQSQVKVTVNLIPNTVRKYEVALVVDVERVGEEVISLPITARSLVPEISNAMPILNYGRCFLRYPYEHQVSLHNDTDLVAKYEIVRQDEDQAENDPITYGSRKPKGIIPAQSVVDVPLVIQANVLGEQEMVCFITIFGDPKPLTVNIVCVGEGPVVHLNPHALDWGDIPVLVDNERTLTLSNEAFIPAQFEARFLKSNTVFRVSQSNGEIPPEDSIVLKVIVNLDDCLRFQDKLIISFSDSQTRQIPLQAVGKGTTVISDPHLGPILNLGPNFSNRVLQKHFKLTNKGRRIQQLVWLTDGYSHLSKAKRHSGVRIEGTQPVFMLTPNRMELNPGESIDLTIEGFVQGPQIVSETIVCHAIIGRAGGKVPIISVNVRAEFIEPLLNFSTKCAFFRVDKEQTKDLEIQEKQLFMNNVSSLPLTVGLKLAYPFSMIIDGLNIYETSVCLHSGDVYTVNIEFDPKFKDDCHIRTIDEVLYITYEEHPHVDYISLRGEVYFPNLEFEKTSINFGCILNDTEVTRYINITNISPMKVCYHWSFLVGDVPTFIRKMRSTKPLMSADTTHEEPSGGEEKEGELVEGDEHSRNDTFESLDVEERKSDEDKMNESQGTDDRSTFEEETSKKEESVIDDNKNLPDSQNLITPEEDVPEKGQLEQEGKLDEENEKASRKRSSSSTQLSLVEGEEECLRRNKVLSALLEEEDDDDDMAAIGVEEVFDILPLYGCLEPGETEQVTFTFYGHANILGEVCAVCTVEDGPSYELKLTGEASLLEYAFSSKMVDFGKQMYDFVATSTITLMNTGKVGFDFTTVNMDPSLETRPLRGQPIMVPHSGFIEPLAEQKIEIRYLPGIPDFFEKTFQIQVAHFKPDTITIFGEGVFPRVSLDLPRLDDEAGQYACLLKEARENLVKMIAEQHEKTLMEHSSIIDVEEVVKPLDLEEPDAKVEESAKDKAPQPPEPGVRDPTELELQMEVERLAMRNRVLLQQCETDFPNSDGCHHDSGHNHLQPVHSDITAFSFDATSVIRTKPSLPDYVLDFGYVVLGTVRTHVIRATNTGWFPVSFKLERHTLLQSGFQTELDRVRNLPGAPDNETLDFVISFDPRGANLHLGATEVVVPINIVKGPVINLRLRAHVTMPDMKVSDDMLHFGEVKCGECKVITVQLHNHQMVKCEWNASPPDDRKKVEKHIPMHLRRKMRHGKKQPSIFEVLPPTGILLPGQKTNVQVKFMPTEEKTYDNRIQIHISQSSQRVLLMCHGRGLEPRLDFEYAVLQFDPILPHSVGDEQQVVVRNPCSFPIEFYSLEFDTNYLYEERVLRLMRGYDEFNTLLLPPRHVKEKLPHELLNYYDEQFKKVDEEEKIHMQAEAKLAAEMMERENEERERQKKETQEKEREEKEKEAKERHEKGKQAEHDSQVEKLSNDKDGKGKKTKEKETENKTKNTPDIQRRELLSSHATLLSASNAITDKASDDVSFTMKSQAEFVTPVISSTTTGSASMIEIPSEAAETVVTDAADDYLHRVEDLLEEKMKKAFASGPGVGELEITPVSAAIARYLGIDLTSEGKAARNRRGIAIVIQGAPLSGKTTTAIALAKHYEAALLTVDGVVCDAIANGNTAAGLKARELCSQAARKISLEITDLENVESEKKPGGLSVEAVAAHTQAGVAATRKVSMFSEQKSKVTGTGRTTFVTSSLEGATGSQVPSSPPLVLGPIPRKLSVSASIAGEDGLVSCVLPDDLLVTILAERLQLNDCYRGVVFDGLETLFSQSYCTTASAILKALNNRRFIYFCTLKLDYNVLKEQEEKAKKMKVLEEQEKELAELKMLEEMDEEEYDVLPDDMKAKIDKKMLLLKKDRIRREKEKVEKERLEREAKEEEDRRKEEEKTRGKGRKAKAAESKDKRSQGGKLSGPDQAKKGVVKAQEGEKGPDRPDSLPSDKFNVHGEKKKGKKDAKLLADQLAVEEQKDPAKEAEILLMQRFNQFEAAQKDIQDLLELWDRSTLQLRRPLTPSDRSEEDLKDLASGKKSKLKDKLEKDKHREQERHRQEKEHEEKAHKGPSQVIEEAESVEAEEDKKEEFGIPNIIIDCANRTFVKPLKIVKSEVLPDGTSVEEAENITFLNMTLDQMLLLSGKLPSLDIVLDGLGLGPLGPPIPPPVTFAVVPFPVKRRSPAVPVTGGQYVFVASSHDDPNIGPESKDPESELKEDDKAKTVKITEKGGRSSSDSKADRKRSAERKKPGRRNSSNIQSPQPGQITPISDMEGGLSELDEINPSKKLTVFRWTVPAHGCVKLQMRFSSNDLGQFDRTMNFEIVGTRRRYQIFCRGICSFPTISMDPRVVFASKKKNRTMGEIVHKKYILATNTFEFGPLLVGKSRERYREGRYPENMAHFTIFNTSSMESDVSFCFLYDSRGDTFMLEPASMLLKPGESSKLLVWAYPRGPGHYEDVIVCCMRENPEPILFKVSCDGFRPELELDKKVLQFDKVLLHRKDTKTIFLINNTQLPVAWKLSGLENLGDDFTVAADSGIVEPLSEYPLHAYFRAMKATNSKKMIRIEISDADNILGVVLTEPIQIIAEAYDVALDMSFPKGLPDTLPCKFDSSLAEMLASYSGPCSSKTEIVTEIRQFKKGDKFSLSTPLDEKKLKTRRVSPTRAVTPPTFSLASSKGTDGGLDFGIIKVNEESRQLCTLKNKGRYEIAFNFVLENVNQKKPDIASLFTVFPKSGKLGPVDKPTQVQVIFKSSREVAVKDMPVLKCLVIEPTLGEKGETIASIPVRVSVKVVFSKFNIAPSNDMNFGALLVGSRKTRTFAIENKGEFDFKFIISKKDKDQNLASVKKQSRVLTKGDKNYRSQEDLIQDKSKKGNSFRQDGIGQSKLVAGMFTVFPAYGIVLPKGNQVITVECIGEIPGKETQNICIEITDRDPTTYKGGVPYQLIAEACIPSINVDDVGSIFEEHRVCKNLSVWQHINCGQSEIGGIYGEEEKKFIFSNVIVGRPAKARFKISNPYKVPCDVVFSLKSLPLKGTPKSSDVFDLDPPRTQIANNSHMYVTVTFTPQAMLCYSVLFEASVEGLPPSQSKGKSVTFEVSGEGNLPRITVAKPAVRNKRGQPVLLFKSILIGRSESLPLELVNEGSLPSKVDIDLFDPDNCFLLKPTKQTRLAMGEADFDEIEMRKRPHTASVVVNLMETATFEVIYRPSVAQRSQANLKITVVDNQYEDSVVQMVGEGFEDDITLDNIGSVYAFSDVELELDLTDDEPVCGQNIQEIEEGVIDVPEDDMKSASSISTKSVKDSQLMVAKSNLMQFGDCYINEDRTLNLTMTNHSKTDCVRFQWPDHPNLKFSPQVGHLHANCTKDVAVTFHSDISETFSKCPIQCQVTKITFDKPIDQICDWDDKLQVVKWVDIPPAVIQSAGRDDPETTATETTQNLKKESIETIMEILFFGSKSTTTHLPTKYKVVEIEKEPDYIEVVDTTRNVELLVSAVSDFAKFSCDVTHIHFKDTLMFQTRVYSIPIENVGQVALEYSWQLYVESSVLTMPHGGSLSNSEWPVAQVETVDQSNLPFIVDPGFGTIPPGKSVECVVRFSPLDAKDYEGKLMCSIPYMSKFDPTIAIELKGRSLVPYCHFELEDSDYVSSSRRNPELRGPGGAPPGSALDPNTRVVEFKVCGIGLKSLKEFGIVNPTNKRYWFEWICEDEPDTKRPSNFSCIHKQGEVRCGRKFKVGFEFVSRELDIVESFWRFVIPSESISVPFLLVGNTREPDVCLDRSHLNFKSLLVGHEAKETVYLNNNEDTWFSFTFDENSCHSEGYASHLKVVPMQGQISAKSSVPIDLYFTPSSEQEINFNLRCMVARKVAPLTLNVKAEGYSMNSVLFYEDAAGVRVELSDSEIHVINFGEVEVRENTIRHLFILNSGKFNLDYIWTMSEAQMGACTLSITPNEGSVACGEIQQCSLLFCPHKRMSLKDCRIQLKVVNGRTYQLFLAGLGVHPSLQFSFLTYNFGNCFIHKIGLDLPPKQVVLNIKNKDKKEISVSCLYEPTSHLMHNFEARLLAPNKDVKIPFTFCPRQVIKYHEIVTFEINGLSKQKVEFFGTGSEMKIEVVDPKHKCLNLRARMVGDNVRKFIPIVNNSHVPVTCTLAFMPSEPALQVRDVLSINPKEAITLAARGGSTKVEVWFRPKARIPQFTEEVFLECSGMSLPLFVIKGSCLGLEVSLDSDAISFGTVFLHSSSSRKLLMSNTGDMNTKFRWDIKRFKPDFSISPVEGYITPGMDVTFQVDFHPQTISADVRYEKLKCFLDGGPHKPITLTLTGSCTGILPVKEVQTFQAVVRHSDTKQIMIPNKSNQLWNLKPIIDGEYWTGPVTFTVEPQQTRPYELTYKPLTMTSETSKHAGSIFFPLPDGSGLLFNLLGTADPPRLRDKIQREVPCKTSYTELLPVTNWLKTPQRFHVKIEPLKEKLDPGTTVKGVEYVDVPANGKKDYKLAFYAYKEGTTPVKVTFTNEQTGEYQFYEVMFRATRPGTMASIELTTPVRQTVHHVVSVENPLLNQVNFQINCSVTEVLVPSQFSIPHQSEGQFSFEYQPLKVGVVTGRLELNSPELGLYIYDLVLTATPGAPEKAVYFRTNLGSTVSQVARFLNFAKQKTDYICKIENPDFHVEKSVAAAPGSTGGTEVTLDVSFEPSVLGEQRAMLLISSPIGGEYTVPLFGTCDPPKPQGPFTIKAGTNIPIMFKNVFNTSTQFTFQVDNPLFQVTKRTESIRSHKEHRIVVSFDGSDVRSKAAVMGKLFVSCAHSAGGNSGIQWMYYLKGVNQ